MNKSEIRIILFILGKKFKYRPRYLHNNSIEDVLRNLVNTKTIII